MSGYSKGTALKTTVITGFLGSLALAALLDAIPAAGQVPFEGEVRQIVTFSLLPGRSGEALDLYRERALPLYKSDQHMHAFRVYREVESPVAMDVMVVSSFLGMSGMDSSNTSLRMLAQEAGSSIGSIYGAIGGLSSSHTDQFVEMLPDLGAGDASAARITAFMWFNVEPGQSEAFESGIADTVLPWEKESGVAASTGRVLVSDGWDYLRVVGRESLGDFQSYLEGLNSHGGDELDPTISRRRVILVSNMKDMAIR
ncbi:MAG: hypothetical protein ACI80V_003655 [Rhodothermales bacterium]|jgi:hypothetical protein